MCVTNPCDAEISARVGGVADSCYRLFATAPFNVLRLPFKRGVPVVHGILLLVLEQHVRAELVPVNQSVTGGIHLGWSCRERNPGFQASISG